MRFVNEKPNEAEVAHCDKHGDFEVNYSEWFTGDKFMVNDACHECVAAKKEEEDALLRKEEARNKRERATAAKLKAGLRQRHIDCSLDNFVADTNEKKEALKTASNYLALLIAGTGSCLVMCGSVGTGKTHIASALVNSMLESGKDCRIVKMTELIRKIKETWSKTSNLSETEVIDFYSEIDFLVIDEIGVQYVSDTEKLLISEIIDNRYQAILPTVLISNLDTSGIKKCIGERSYDRLREGGGKVIAFNWKSHRGAA